MKKTFYINNYLNQKANLPSKRQQQSSQLPQSRSQKLDYYEQYLQKHHLQHSQSALPHQHTNSPYKRTFTAETSQHSHKPQETARYQETPMRKSSEQTQKNVTTQRIYYDRSNPDKSNAGNTSMSQLSAGKSDRQWQLQLEININKLKDIKGYLENQIGLLQRLLDQTSQNLQHIDVEFEKIKERVLDYTARSLDAAFRKYKKQMTRWSKYEEVEKKSLEVVIEMRDYIHENERMLEELRQGGSNSNINTLREVSNRVEHYQQTTNQLRRVRQQCLHKHPTLKEEKVLEFERVVEELCCF